MNGRIAAPPAGVPRRLGAMIYDGLLLLALWMLTSLALLPLNDGEAVSGPAYQALLLLEWGAFYIYFWRRRGQTLGMRAWRLQLVASDGGEPALRACFVRLAVAPLSFFAAGLGYLWFYVGSRQQTWHDRASDTFVVLLPKEVSRS